ncbi:DNA translocase FtsK [Terriglobus albidus]|uniref:DNA translocase FtsK n=1 Tax=Terriglobus albidus TaxID=1592106 RepID=A0A5B9EB31_9BACT|nr:DNA translocase FtsK [Terriglobus albidus]QEE27621.1 DNA translocase FtsK [Terriglobus albidus]
MKPLRFVTTPTRNRRLNELIGLAVLVAGGLLALALVSYTPTDPSWNTVGGYATGRPAHNWTGIVGAFISDATLQLLGIAAFAVPLSLMRLGYCWMRSRPAGSPVAKLAGLAIWIFFGPAMFALLPGHMLWRSTLPIEGVEGRLMADAVIALLNFPGACIVVGLMVVMATYLSTTFTFNTAREWATARFAFLQAMQDRWRNWRGNRASRADRAIAEYESKRERAMQRDRRSQEKADRKAQKATATESTSLLSSLFGWWGRKKAQPQPLGERDNADPVEAEGSPAPSVWAKVPRTMVDAPAESGEPALPAAYAAAAEERLHQATIEEPTPEWAHHPAQAEPETPRKVVSFPAPVAPAAQQPETEEKEISFGKRADEKLKTVTLTAKSVHGYKLPPSSLLHRSEEPTIVREEALREEARTLVEKCAEFDVHGQVTQINPGPVVTTFEFRPEAGVKYSRVTGLADDLCLAMAAESILIERMAGKSTVGIQVPNSERETIWLRDVVESEHFANTKSRLAMAMGKDINGRIVTADLAAMPHVLIAGSTGSGKSVAINAMIMSVLFKATPEQVRMILVDPKRVELGMYEGIPHLFTPIITEPKLAANALRNAVREMERRLKLLASKHVRNIDQYNKLFENGTPSMFEDDEEQQPLPYIMIIIDELADLMMLDKANVEEAITRLAQMARAVGIHLVLATQRPSVDVITGLIKANVPTRMSFRLATKVDSRTIIDSNGAESLLGRGDMLFLPPGTSRLQRVHAPFVTEKEIAAVTDFWKQQGEAEYVQGFLEGPKDDKGRDLDAMDGDDTNDELFDDAVKLVFEFGKASTSLLQRRLRIGYGRAAHLIDMMERDGLVGPAEGSKPREILKSPDWLRETDPAMR